jgi:hypothetical protein
MGLGMKELPSSPCYAVPSGTCYAVTSGQDRNGERHQNEKPTSQ